VSANLPPADELFAVRDGIKQLQSRERELRSLMLSDPSARTGNLYAVTVKDVLTTRTDLAEMRKMYPEIVEQFTAKLTDQRVMLSQITEDGELVSLRRKLAEPVPAQKAPS